MVSSPIRRGRVFVALCFLIVAAVEAVTVTERAAVAAPLTSAGFTTSTTGESAVSAGSAVVIQANVTSNSSRQGLVDVEVYDLDGHKVFQDFWDHEAFTAGTPRSFVTTWPVSWDQPLGVYRIKVGIFATGWTSLVHWNDGAGSISVLAASTSGTGPTPRGGIATGTVLSSPLTADLSLIASIVPGGFVRTDYTWGTVQPRNDPDPRTWSWSKYDARVATIHSAGLRVLAMLGYTPSWANGGSSDDKRPPAPGFTWHWQQFCNHFAKRYIPEGVTVFEVWNEPNLTRFWSTGPNVKDYVRRVLVPCATGLRQAAATLNTPITIITGGTAPATNGTNIDPRTWATGLYANGAQPYFDAIGHHPYTWPYPPYQNAAMAPGSFAPNQWNSMIQTLDMRATMLRHGDADKQIWATEVGLPSRDEGPTFPTAGHQNFVSNDLMVTRIDEIFTAWFGMETAADSGWIGPLIWYQHRNQSSAVTSVEGGFGVTYSSGADKPGTSITPRQALTDAFSAHR